MTSVRSVVSLGTWLKAKVSADLALVAEEAGRLGAAGDEEVRQAVVIAVEDGHAAAGEELVLAVVAVVEAGVAVSSTKVGTLGWPLDGLAARAVRRQERAGQPGGSPGPAAGFAS